MIAQRAVILKDRLFNHLQLLCQQEIPAFKAGSNLHFEDCVKLDCLETDGINKHKAFRVYDQHLRVL